MPTEDDIYRSSTQFRLWNFTPKALADMRSQTNTIARGHVRQALKRKRDSNPTTEETSSKESTPAAPGNAENGARAAKDIDFLTAEEEKILVDFFCAQLLNLVASGKFRELPIHVTATAIQYIRRFYLTNSVMSYHPKSIMTTALFLATKTESYHMGGIHHYAELLSSVQGLSNITVEEVLAPEYILTQGLRFCFDVRHPHRALKGAFIELQLILSLGRGTPAPQNWHLNSASAQVIQKELLEAYGPPAQFEKKIERAYARAREILQRPAILSDAYFLYTPSQIMFASLWIADRALTERYFDIKYRLISLRPKPPNDLDESRPRLHRILSEIEACARLLESVEPDESKLRKAAIGVDKKLFYCRNPDKEDLVKLNAAQKRDNAEDGRLDESLVKKRRLDREKIEKEGDDLFGPALGENNGES